MRTVSGHATITLQGRAAVDAASPREASVEAWLRWTFGVACPGCGVGLGVGRPGPFCADCGRTAELAGPGRTLAVAQGWVQVVARWRYGGAVAAAVQRIKFAGAPPCLNGLAEGTEALLRELAGPGPLTLMPVAPQRRRLARRGFHLPDRLASAMAASDPGLRIDAGLRRLDVHPPRSLRPELQPDFALAPSSGAGPVWLIDDVVTTGATLRRVAAALQTAGRPLSGAICLCDARGRSVD